MSCKPNTSRFLEKLSTSRTNGKRSLKACGSSMISVSNGGRGQPFKARAISFKRSLLAGPASLCASQSSLSVGESQSERAARDHRERNFVARHGRSLPSSARFRFSESLQRPRTCRTAGFALHHTTVPKTLNPNPKRSLHLSYKLAGV